MPSGAVAYSNSSGAHESGGSGVPLGLKSSISGSVTGNSRSGTARVSPVGLPSASSSCQMGNGSPQ